MKWKLLCTSLAPNIDISNKSLYFLYLIDILLGISITDVYGCAHICVTR